MEAGPEMNAKVATDVMEWTLLAGDTWIDNNNRIAHPNFRPSTSIAAAWLVEERIAELGLIKEYCDHMRLIVWPFQSHPAPLPLSWYQIHASPEDRCRAALLACEGETGKALDRK